MSALVRLRHLQIAIYERQNLDCRSNKWFFIHRWVELEEEKKIIQSTENRSDLAP